MGYCSLSLSHNYRWVSRQEEEKAGHRQWFKWNRQTWGPRYCNGNIASFPDHWKVLVVVWKWVFQCACLPLQPLPFRLSLVRNLRELRGSLCTAESRATLTARSTRSGRSGLSKRQEPSWTAPIPRKDTSARLHHKWQSHALSQKTCTKQKQERAENGLWGKKMRTWASSHWTWPVMHTMVLWVNSDD